MNDKGNNPLHAYTISSQEVIKIHSGNPKTGLTQEEATKRLSIYGSNKLKDSTEKSILQILWHQINNILTYILLIAIVLSILADHATDAVVVGILVFVNVTLGFYHEYKAEKRMTSLKKLVKFKCRVLRDSKVTNIDSDDLVPGDIVILEDGQIVPADIRVIKSNELTVIESGLTGESIPVQKEDIVLEEQTALGDRTNMLYKSTHITSGEGLGIVDKTGIETEIGKISVHLDAVKPEKALFFKRTEKLLRQMILVALATASFTIIIMLIRGESIETIVQLSFATIISGIPEGLPSVLTVLLSIASVRMSQKNALLRNFPAIESLSTVSTIITDKTGTLTQNVMSVNQMMLHTGDILDISGEGWKAEGEFSLNTEKIDPTDNSHIKEILYYLALTSYGDAIEKDGKFELLGYPTEVARYILSKKAGITKELSEEIYHVIDSRPYDQETKFKSALVENTQNPSRKPFLIVIGGAENVLKRCNPHPTLLDYSLQRAKEGYRMQAIAIKEDCGRKINENDIKDLTPLAVLEIADPIRPDVAKAIDITKKAGIRVIMATGDHVATAFSIAKQAGIIPQDADPERIYDYAISQTEIDKLNEEDFKQKVQSVNVFARVTPLTKQKIGQILQGKGEIIAMTGDGVNDAPILKSADIGIAMGNIGSDVAKEASDLLLLDDSFPTIVDAIKEGRSVFKSMRRTSLYLVTTNLAEDLMILTSVLVGTSLPLLPIQILWLNLVTDGVSDIALATEPSRDEVMSEMPRNKKEGIITKQNLIFITLNSILMALISLSFFFPNYAADPQRARTLAFSSMVFLQLVNVVNMRSLDLPIKKIGYFTNKAINISLIISLTLFGILIYSPGLKELFQFTNLSFRDMLLIIASSLPILMIGEIYKYMKLKRQNAKNA